MYGPLKRVKLIDSIRASILEKTCIKNHELAKEIARKWLRN